MKTRVNCGVSRDGHVIPGGTSENLLLPHCSILSLSDPFGDLGSDKFRTAPSKNIGEDSFYEPLGGRSSQQSGLKLYDMYGGQKTPTIPKYQTDDSVISFGPKFNASESNPRLHTPKVLRVTCATLMRRGETRT